MEDALKFLLVAGLIIYGLVKQARKNARGTAASDDDADGIPVPDAANPLPENWGKAAKPAPAPRPAKPKPKRHEPEPFIPTAHRPNTTRRHTPPPPPAPQPPTGKTDNGDENASDIDPRTLEEVRKGIIWAEILNRKY